MAQQIIVYAVGVLIVAHIAVSVYRLVTRRRDPCAGCAGCDLKNEFERKRSACPPGKKGNCEYNK